MLVVQAVNIEEVTVLMGTGVYTIISYLKFHGGITHSIYFVSHYPMPP